MVCLLAKCLTWVIVVAAPAAAAAEELATLKVDLTDTNVVEKYRLDSVLNIYQAVSSTSRQKRHFSGTGALSQMDMNLEGFVAFVVGVDINGYERLSYVVRNQTLYIILTEMVDGVRNGIHVKYHDARFEVETEIVSGSLEDLITSPNGRLIVKPTSQGRIAMGAHRAKIVGEVTKQLATKILNKPDAPPFVADVSVDDAQVSDDSRYEITRNEVNVSIPVASYSVVVTIRSVRRT
jgi:hypothetical protein